MQRVQASFNSGLIGMIESEVRKAGYSLQLYSTDKAEEILNKMVTVELNKLSLLYKNNEMAQ